MTRRPYGVRLDVEGARRFRSEMDAAGRDGAQAFERIDRSARGANRGLVVFNRGAIEARDAVDDLSRRSALGDFGRSIGLSAAAATAALIGLYYGAKRATDAIAQIGDAADRAQVDPGLYEKLAAALTQAGQPADGLEQSLVALQKRVGQMRGELGGGSKAITALGIDLRGAAGEAKSTEAILFELADAFARIEDPAIRGAAAQDLFGRSGGAMIPILQGGSARLREYFEEAERVGLLFGGDLIRRAQEINAEFATQAAIIDVQLKKALIEAAPAIRDLTGEFVRMLPEIIRATQEFLAFLGVVSRPVVSQIDSVTKDLERLVAEEQKHKATLEKLVGLEMTDPGFEDALRESGVLAQARARAFNQVGEAIDGAHDKLKGLESQLMTLTAPAARLPTPPTPPTPGGGGRAAAAQAAEFERATAAAEKQIAALRFENETRGLAVEAIAAQRLETELLAAAQAQYGEITPEIAARIAALTEAMRAATAEKERARAATERLRDEERRAAEAARQMEADVRRGISTIASEIEGVIGKTKSWQQALFSVAKTLLELPSVQNRIGGFFDNLFQVAPARPSAEGNAFAGGNVIPFRHGGILDQPTFFSFGAGRQVGVGGEAGDEALLPLTRNARGDLTVAAPAPPAPVVNIYTRDPETSASFGPSRAQTGRLVRRYAARAVQ